MTGPFRYCFFTAILFFFVWRSSLGEKQLQRVCGNQIAIRSGVAEQKIYCDNSDELIYAYTYFQSGGGAMSVTWMRATKQCAMRGDKVYFFFGSEVNQRL